MSIASVVQQCLTLFAELTREGSSLQAPQRPELLEEQGRFKIWAGNLSAHRSTGRRSLEYRLRDSVNLKNRVVSILQDLEEELGCLSGADLGSLDAIGVPDIECPALAFEYDAPLAGANDEAVQAIHGIINLLYRFSLTLKNPAGHSRIREALHITADVRQSFDIAHVQEKFPQGQAALVHRASQAMASRRQYLRYREQRHSKKVAGLTRHSVDDTDDTITATSVPRTSDSRIESVGISGDVDTICSETSYALSENDPFGLRPPSFPVEGQDGKPFECPICFEIVSCSNDLDWRRHVFDDVPPYVCTYAECSSGSRLYPSRREWQRHEAKMHRALWLCAEACSYSTEDLCAFEQHLQLAHHKAYSKPSFLNFAEENCLPRSDDGDHRCPFCQTLLESPRQWYRHVGHHQEQLALFCLPPYCFPESEAMEPEGPQGYESELEEMFSTKFDEYDGVPRLSSSTNESVPESSDEARSRRRMAEEDLFAEFFGRGKQNLGRSAPDAISMLGRDQELTAESSVSSLNESLVAEQTTEPQTFDSEADLASLSYNDDQIGHDTRSNMRNITPGNESSLKQQETKETALHSSPTGTRQHLSPRSSLSQVSGSVSSDYPDDARTFPDNKSGMIDVTSKTTADHNVDGEVLSNERSGTLEGTSKPPVIKRTTGEISQLDQAAKHGDFIPHIPLRDAPATDRGNSTGRSSNESDTRSSAYDSEKEYLPRTAERRERASSEPRPQDESRFASSKTGDTPSFVPSSGRTRPRTPSPQRHSRRQSPFQEPGPSTSTEAHPSSRVTDYSRAIIEDSRGRGAVYPSTEQQAELIEQHQRQKHQDGNDLNEAVEAITEGTETQRIVFACQRDGCGKTFTREKGLIRHYDTVHRESDIVYICDFPRCGKTHYRKDKMQEHCQKRHGQRRGEELFSDFHYQSGH